jgi:hypothetical protein
MIANKSGVQLQLSGGSKLMEKSLNIKGYQLSIEQDQQAGPDILMVSLQVRKRPSLESVGSTNNELAPQVDKRRNLRSRRSVNNEVTP